ncbi:hypothetical protein [Acidothermus cellulolyticus]|uniref:hypothetical protein n=1 Tax=Acidothermus cellulolyticus TaxID=28049 RepID=UPI0002E33C12|nr:hypothetical protein [Acidothermus cellulolyticus]
MNAVALACGVAAAYRGVMAVQQPELTESVWSAVGAVKHGYPPPVRAPGTLTTAYCGELIVVQGECTDRPPRDACPLCALAWEQRRRRPW